MILKVQNPVYDLVTMLVKWPPLNVTVFLYVDGYVVDPLNTTEACSQVPVEKQNPGFVHKHPQHVVRRRKRAAPDDCVESVNKAFCGETKEHRKTEVGLLMVLMVG